MKEVYLIQLLIIQMLLILHVPAKFILRTISTMHTQFHCACKTCPNFLLLLALVSFAGIQRAIHATPAVSASAAPLGSGSGGGARVPHFLGKPSLSERWVYFRGFICKIKHFLQVNIKNNVRVRNAQISYNFCTSKQLKN